MRIVTITEVGNEKKAFMALKAVLKGKDSFVWYVIENLPYDAYIKVDQKMKDLFKTYGIKYKIR